MKNKFLFYLCTIGGLLLQIDVAAQQVDQSFEEIFNEFILDEETAEGMEEAYQQLYNFYLKPIDLNKTNRDELRSLRILNDFQISELLNYREKTGEFISVYELQSVPFLELSDIKRIIPFISVSTRSEGAEVSNSILFRFERDLQKRAGYLQREDGTTPYLGTPDKFLFQLRSTPGGRIRYGFTMEKDAGENIIFERATKRYGMDHYSGFVQINDIFKSTDLIVGDYQLQFGQGLVYSSGFSLGKSGGSLATYQRVSSGIRAHSSSAEYGFHRGIASSIYIKDKYKITGFYSLKDHNAASTDASFSSFNTSGFHRTHAELGHRYAVDGNHYGVVFEKKGSQLQYGLGYSHIALSRQWIPSEKAYNSLAFQGSRLNTTFGFVNYQWQNTSTFAEAAYLKDGGLAYLGGVLFNLSSMLQTGIIYRNYQPEFVSLYGNAIGEKSRNSNEKGLLWVVNADFSKKLKARVYLDRFSFPWLSYRISKPSEGYEMMASVNYRPSKVTDLSLQYKQEQKEQDTGQRNLIVPEKTERKQYKARMGYAISERLEMRSAIQGSYTDPADAKGVALMQDIIYKTMDYKVVFRYAIFDTDDYDNRQYVYEHDVLYAFNFPALQGTGYKFYILAKYNVSRNIKCWIRFSHLTYTDRESISSGNEMVEGNKLSEVKFQAIYTF